MHFWVPCRDVRNEMMLAAASGTAAALVTATELMSRSAIWQLDLSLLEAKVELWKDLVGR